MGGDKTWGKALEDNLRFGYLRRGGAGVVAFQVRDTQLEQRGREGNEQSPDRVLKRTLAFI